MPLLKMNINLAFALVLASCCLTPWNAAAQNKPTSTQTAAMSQAHAAMRDLPPLIRDVILAELSGSFFCLDGSPAYGAKKTDSVVIPSGSMKGKKVTFPYKLASKQAAFFASDGKMYNFSAAINDYIEDETMKVKWQVAKYYIHQAGQAKVLESYQRELALMELARARYMLKAMDEGTRTTLLAEVSGLLILEGSDDSPCKSQPWYSDIEGVKVPYYRVTPGAIFYNAQGEKCDYYSYAVAKQKDAVSLMRWDRVKLAIYRLGEDQVLAPYATEIAALRAQLEQRGKSPLKKTLTAPNSGGKVSEVSERQSSVREQGKDFSSSVRLALMNDDVAKLQELFEQGLSIDYVDSSLKMGLMALACSRKALQCLKLIHKKGGSVDGNVEGSKAPINYALDKPEILAYLVENNANLRVVSLGIREALYAAIERGDTALVTILLKAGVYVDTADLKGVTPLMIAAKVGNLAITQQLLAAGADVNQLCDDYGSALSFATAGDHLEVARCLIAAGADVDARAKDGSTPLMFAVRNNKVASVKLLLDHHANIELPITLNGRERTPLDMAYKLKDDEISNLLYELTAESGRINSIFRF